MYVSLPAEFEFMSTPLSEQEVVRREALQELRNQGVNPYPADCFDVNTNSEDIKQNFEKEGGTI